MKPEIKQIEKDLIRWNKLLTNIVNKQNEINENLNELNIDFQEIYDSIQELKRQP